jgi:hypothetical protein
MRVKDGIGRQTNVSGLKRRTRRSLVLDRTDLIMALLFENGHGEGHANTLTLIMDKARILPIMSLR